MGGSVSQAKRWAADISLCLLCAVMLPAAAVAQTVGYTPRKDAAEIPSYELVSIHKTTETSVNPGIHDEPNGMNAIGQSLRAMIAEAYSFSLGTVSEQLITSVPAWAKTQLFDLHAKVDPDNVKKMEQLEAADTMAETVREMATRTPSYRMVMLQRVLEDRFHLKVHYEQKEMSLYEMTLAKGGVRMPVAHPKNPNSGTFSMSAGKLDGENVPVSFIAVALALVAERPVEDKTDAKGSYDFKLRWTGMDAALGAGADEAAPSLFTAVEEQMGLKLKAGRGPVWVIVVDHAEMPTEN